MKEIIVHSKKHGSKIILVDDIDFEYLSQFKWAIKKNRNTFYACRTFSDNKMRYMHRVILEVNINSLIVDHKDGNGLNNQRDNLRLCNDFSNKWNSTSNIGTSKYKGVSYCKATKKWVAGIMANGNRTKIGRFHNEDDAAKAYNEHAIKLHGSFARLNDIQI